MSFPLGSLNPLLDARFFGSPVFEAAASSTTEHTITFPFKCKFNGLDIYSNASEIGHKMNVITEYPYNEEYRRFKKSTKDWNIFPSQKVRIHLFPVEPVAGIRLKIFYTNTSIANCKFAINLFTFVDQQIVNPLEGEQGEDW